MTIGERIKYFRKKAGITQAELARRTGIHPVSVRKYETNKMTPQTQHICKIAEALGVNSFALTGIEDHINFEGDGNIVGILIFLFQNHFLEISGIRNQPGRRLEHDSLKIRVNPALAKLFSVEADDKTFNAEDLILRFKSEDLRYIFAAWESIMKYDEEGIEAVNGCPAGELDRAYEKFKDARDSYEMSLQRQDLKFDAGKNGS